MTQPGDFDPTVIVRSLERDLGIPTGFFDALFEEDDWSFIVKLHALFEGALSHLLEHRLREQSLGPVLARLEMSNSQTGKLAFAAALGLLEKNERKYLTQLSEVRNQLVHDVRNVQFSLEAYVRAFDDNQRKSYIESFAAFFSPSQRTANFQEETRRLVLENTKLAYWAASLLLLSRMYEHKELARVQAEFDATLRRTFGGVAG